MRYYSVADSRGSRLIAEEEDVFDLTSVKPELATFHDLVKAAEICDEQIDTVAKRLAQSADEADQAILHDDLQLPVKPGEVWAAGVTYEISQEARRNESAMSEVYLDVYDSDRPEVFIKATPSRTVGPQDAIGVRGDSNWNTPEPELGIVLYNGETVGFTIGNDMSSRAIEGRNPLYLPQAKIYDRCCSIGPCVASPETIGDPHDLTIDMTIERDGDLVFEDSTSTSKMVRSCEELVEVYQRHNTLPEMAVLLTGTSIVPPDNFTVLPDDRVTISIENIGSLENSVCRV